MHSADDIQVCELTAITGHCHEPAFMAQASKCYCADAGIVSSCMAEVAGNLKAPHRMQVT